MAVLATKGEAESQDVVLVPAPYDEHDAHSSRPDERFRRPYELDSGLWLGPFDRDLRKEVLDACSPAGEHSKRRPFGCAYAFWRTLPPGSAAATGDHFDPDARLYRCVTFSRIVHPTSVGFEYAARIQHRRNGVREIIPYREYHLNPHAFVIDPNTNWLIPSNVPEIKTLLLAFPPTGMPERLHSALFTYEVAARHCYIDQRWPLVATGLEALVHIRGERHPGGRRWAGSTKVFVDRLLAMGTIDAALAIPEADLRAMYAERSLLAHGQAFGSLDAARKNLYRRMEKLLRDIARKAICDSKFRAIFASDAALQTALPLRP